MKSFARLSVLAVLIAGIGVSVHAQADETISRVPFAFTVGSTSMPRDTYRVTRIAGRTAFMIQSEHHAAIMLALPEGREDNQTPRLVFHRYGDRYFLREIRMPDNTGFELPVTRDERQAAEQIAGVSTHEVVVVHANDQ